MVRESILFLAPLSVVVRKSELPVSFEMEQAIRRVHQSMLVCLYPTSPLAALPRYVFDEVIEYYVNAELLDVGPDECRSPTDYTETVYSNVGKPTEFERAYFEYAVKFVLRSTRLSWPSKRIYNAYVPSAEDVVHDNRLPTRAWTWSWPYVRGGVGARSCVTLLTGYELEKRMESVICLSDPSTEETMELWYMKPTRIEIFATANNNPYGAGVPKGEVVLLNRSAGNVSVAPEATITPDALMMALAQMFEEGSADRAIFREFLSDMSKIASTREGKCAEPSIYDTVGEADLAVEGPWKG